MSLSLKLIIEENSVLSIEYGRPVSGESTLCLGYVAEELKDDLRGVAMPLTEGVYIYADEGLEKQRYDALGDAITFAHAVDLAEALKKHTSGAWAHSICAMMAALPADTRVVLYWQ